MSNLQNKLLEKLVLKGAGAKNLEMTAAIGNRISKELTAIESSNSVDYFILYSRIMEICNELGLIRSPGRGTAAGSLVNYCLDITKINPLEHNLVFEMFLNSSRGNVPDIDIDIPEGHQEEVINLLKHKYPEYHSYFIAYLPKGDTEYKDVLYNNEVYKQHPCGIVITQKKLKTSTFIFDDKPFYLTPNTSSDALFEQKIDILELPYLNKLQVIVNNIGEKYHPYNLPLDDKDTFTLLSAGDNEHIYQFHTSYMQKALKSFKPQNIEDFSILNATYRPGPMELIPTIILNKQCGYEPFFKNESINQILSETYGVLVYREDFLEILTQLTDFSYKEADIWLRRLFSSVRNKETELINDFSRILTEKLAFLDSRDRLKLIDMLCSQVELVFPKSHSLCYSRIGYWGAFYKTHFKDEFQKAFNPV